MAFQVPGYTYEVDKLSFIHINVRGFLIHTHRHGHRHSIAARLANERGYSVLSYCTMSYCKLLVKIKVINVILVDKVEIKDNVILVDEVEIKNNVILVD